jgi:hypothetical protein
MEWRLCYGPGSAGATQARKQVKREKSKNQNMARFFGARSQK